MKTKHCLTIDLDAPYTEYGRGVVKGNPKRCIKCGRPIKDGEAWRKDVSPTDRRYGSYAIIRHAECKPN